MSIFAQYTARGAHFSFVSGAFSDYEILIFPDFGQVGENLLNAFTNPL